MKRILMAAGLAVSLAVGVPASAATYYVGPGTTLRQAVDLSNRFVWIVLLVTLGFGAVGWVDDWRKVVHRNPKGLSACSKFFF